MLRFVLLDLTVATMRKRRLLWCRRVDCGSVLRLAAGRVVYWSSLSRLRRLLIRHVDAFWAWLPSLIVYLRICLMLWFGGLVWAE